MVRTMTPSPPTYSDTAGSATTTDKRDRTILNERLKLVANACNAAGIGALAAGIVTPFANRFWHVAGAGAGSGAGPSATLFDFVLALGIWLAVLVALNVAGLLVLGCMKEP